MTSNEEHVGLRDLTYLYVDSETTGFGSQHSPCEIAGVLIRGGRVLETYETLVDPGRSIPPEVTRIHGIDDDMVIGAPRLHDALLPLARLLPHADAVAAHNVLFDRPMMKFAEDAPWICTLSWARHHFKEGPWRLDVLAERIGMTKHAPAHAALADARMGARILTYFMENSELAQTIATPRELADHLVKREIRFQEERNASRAFKADVAFKAAS